MTQILLHVCCAPCATYPIEVLKNEGKIAGYFANPNIQPAEEYGKRLEEARRFFSQVGLEIIEAPYDPDEWNETVKGLEDEPEGGKRCEKCFRLRLEKTARTAKQLRYDCFTTTLTVSRYKNSKLIHRIGNEVAQEIGIGFRKDDFKKKGGCDRSIKLSRELGFYMQDYCGCLFSLRDRRRK